MGDLKTFWPDKDQVFTGTDTSGAGITERGTDANIGAGETGSGAIDPFWPNQPVTDPGTAESRNSVSGLPSLPNRFEPSETPPTIPDLTDRSPGTIDKR